MQNKTRRRISIKNSFESHPVVWALSLIVAGFVAGFGAKGAIDSLTSYEFWSLSLTAFYSLLTFGLLVVVAYDAIIKPRKEDLALYFKGSPPDTKDWGWSRQLMDIVIDNRGAELRNVTISSHPDFLGWDQLGDAVPTNVRATSEYFKKTVPIISKGAGYRFFWCDAKENTEVLRKPFTIIIEYDDTMWFFTRRKTKQVHFDFSVFDGTIFPLTEKFDIHNVAQELSRIRESLEKSQGQLSKNESKMPSKNKEA